MEKKNCQTLAKTLLIGYHPLSVIINFCGKPKEFKILDYSKDVKKELVIEKLKILFNLNNFSIILNFSNNLKIPSKKIFIFKDKKKLIYDGYKKTNQRSVKLLLDDFYKLKKKNDINENKETYKLFFKIDNKIKKID